MTEYKNNKTLAPQTEVHFISRTAKLLSARKKVFTHDITTFYDFTSSCVYPISRSFMALISMREGADIFAVAAGTL